MLHTLPVGMRDFGSTCSCANLVAAAVGMRRARACAEHDEAPPRHHDPRSVSVLYCTLHAHMPPLVPVTELAVHGTHTHSRVAGVSGTHWYNPGIISTGLEMWKGRPCAPKFRERIWGESIMLRKMLLNPRCWLQHMALNDTTGARHVRRCFLAGACTDTHARVPYSRPGPGWHQGAGS